MYCSLAIATASCACITSMLLGHAGGETVARLRQLLVGERRGRVGDLQLLPRRPGRATPSATS